MSGICDFHEFRSREVLGDYKIQNVATKVTVLEHQEVL